MAKTEFSRRSFLKIAGASTAAASLGGFTGCLKAGETFVLVEGVEPSEWRKGVCRYCGTGCGVEMGIKDGKLVAMRGIEDYPVNKGTLCLKGLTLAHVVHSNERAVQPLIREGDNFRATSWDESLNMVADKMRETIEKYGKDSVAVYLGAQVFTEEFFVINKLFKGAIGTNNVEANARVCMASAVTGFLTTFGKDEPPGGYDDIEHSNCFFIIGSNLAEQHPVIFGRILKRRAENKDVRIIVADPRMTPTAAHADVWLPFYPGTDMALLNSMAYVLVKEGYADWEFMEKHIKIAEGGGAWGPEKEVSKEKYLAFLEDYAPEKIAEETGVEATRIYEASRLFGKSKSAMTLWTMGFNQRKWGTWVNNLAYNLHFLTGKICKPGSTALSMTGQPNACGGVRECGSLAHLLPTHRLIKKPEHRAEMEKIWGVPAGSIDPKPGPHTLKMFEMLNSGKIKFMWVICSNPAQSLPDLNFFNKGMEKAFMVVQDIFPPTQALPEGFPHKTAEFADVFLPSAFWAEKGGVFGNTERRSMLTEKVIEPPKGLMADWEIMVEVAKRAGYGKYFQYTSRKQIWDEYRETSKGTDMDLYGATYEKMLKNGGQGVQWPSLTEADNGSPRRYEIGTDLYLQKLVAEGKVDIPDDGIYFYGQKDGKARLFMRPQMPPAEVPDKDYPLYLTTGRVIHHWHTGTMTMRVPWLKKKVEHAYVEMNEEDAERLGVKEGDTVTLSSRRGSLKLTALVPKLDGFNARGLEGRASIPRPGVVFVPFFDAKKLINLLTINAYDAMSKEPEYKICACKIEKG